MILIMKKYLHPFQIGDLVIPENIALAPMAGTSTCIYRTIAHEHGAAFGVTELVSARGIRFKKSVEISMRYLRIDPEHAAAVFGDEIHPFLRIAGLRQRIDRPGPQHADRCRERVRPPAAG